MKKLSLVLIAALVSVALATAAVAGEKAQKVTLEGKIVCAKCAMKTEGAKDCQNVLVVNEGEDAEHFFLTKNDVYKEYGEVCMAKKAVKVTGTVMTKNDEYWLTAEKIEPVNES